MGLWRERLDEVIMRVETLEAALGEIEELIEKYHGTPQSDNYKDEYELAYGLIRAISGVIRGAQDA